MSAAGIFLLVLWTGSHMLILTVLRDTRQTRTTLVTITLMIILAYLIKPYTYDLNKYSIYFHTGFISTQAWHFVITRAEPQGEFRLDPLDTTGEPFDQAFEVGFAWLAKLGHRILPAGSLFPRLDIYHGDFRNRGPPRSDAMILVIMVLGFMALLGGVRLFPNCRDGRTCSRTTELFLATPIILGSVFFVLGSQNSLRQFVGLAIVMLAISSMASRRYLLSVALTGLSSIFHQWAPILGLIGMYLVMLGNINVKLHVTRDVHPFRLSRPEMISLISGIMLVVSIKLIMVTGIFNLDIPLIGDLKSYVIKEDEFNFVKSVEKISVLLKACMICGLVLISEGLIGQTKLISSPTNDIRSLRRRAIIFILPLAIYPEIFSRIIIFYWGLEIMFLVWALNSNIVRVRLGGAVVFVAYGFAHNAINVLVGPNWMYNLSRFF